MSRISLYNPTHYQKITLTRPKTTEEIILESNARLNETWEDINKSLSNKIKQFEEENINSKKD